MIRTLQHVGLTLPRPEEGARFYETFGLDVVESPTGVVARCAGRDQDQMRITEGAKPGLHYLSFGVRAADVVATKQKLEARGVALLDPPSGGPEGLWFRDPDGNLVNLSTEASATPRAAHPIAINTSSALGRAAARGCLEFGAAAKPIRLCHVILFSPSPPKQAEFYQSVLGMKLSDRVGDDMVMFLRGASDGDHHLLGLLRDPTPGLHHASFEMDSLDHIQLGAATLKDAGYKHVWGTGRHTVGSNLFHFFRDPWGTLAEYSYDIDFIPEGSSWETRSWTKEQGLFLWSTDGPPPPDFPRNLLGAK